MGCLENLEFNISLKDIVIGDAGDIPTHLTLEQAHEELKLRVRAVMLGGSIPFVIGGGNDQSFPNVCAFMDILSQETGCAMVRVLCLYLDIQPSPGSTRSHKY
jgi:formiminoglutamase